MPTTDFFNLPQFISSDSDEILAQCQARYTAIVGKPLLPAQTEAIMIQVIAYREKLMRDAFNAGGRQMLLDFSTAPLLDFIVALVGVTRLPEQRAGCNMTYTLIAGHTGVTIPALHRVQTLDGKAVFQTTVDTFVPAGTYTATVKAFAAVAGVSSNDYAIGAVSSILDPLGFVVSAINSTATAGGSNSESDANLVARAKLAPSAFTNAGSYKAYQFWALTASPLIVDCAVLGPQEDMSILPGEVQLYPLVPGGATPTVILDAVYAACNADKRRPLNDLVTVLSPTGIAYDVVIGLTLYKSADFNSVSDDVSQRVNNYCQARLSQMGQDVTISQLVAIAGKDTSSVYNSVVTINGVTADLTITPKQYAKIGTITVNITGYSNG